MPFFFNEQLLGIDFVVGTVLGTRNTAVRRQSPCSYEVHILAREGETVENY
jgi:hypothetical protein